MAIVTYIDHTLKISVTTYYRCGSSFLLEHVFKPLATAPNNHKTEEIRSTNPSSHIVRLNSEELADYKKLFAMREPTIRYLSGINQTANIGLPPAEALAIKYSSSNHSLTFGDPHTVPHIVNSLILSKIVGGSMYNIDNIVAYLQSKITDTAITNYIDLHWRSANDKTDDHYRAQNVLAEFFAQAKKDPERVEELLYLDTQIYNRVDQFNQMNLDQVLLWLSENRHLIRPYHLDSLLTQEAYHMCSTPGKTLLRSLVEESINFTSNNLWPHTMNHKNMPTYCEVIVKPKLIFHTKENLPS